MLLYLNSDRLCFEKAKKNVWKKLGCPCCWLKGLGKLPTSGLSFYLLYSLFSRHISQGVLKQSLYMMTVSCEHVNYLFFICILGQCVQLISDH